MLIKHKVHLSAPDLDCCRNLKSNAVQETKYSPTPVWWCEEFKLKEFVISKFWT